MLVVITASVLVLVGGAWWWLATTGPAPSNRTGTSPATLLPTAEPGRSTGQPVITPQPSAGPAPEPWVDLVAEWQTAVATAYATSDLAAACVLLAGPPREVPTDSLDLQRSRLWPWLLTGRAPHAPEPPAVTQHSPPPPPRDEGPRFQQVLPDPQVLGGWLGMSWKAIYRCGAERDWRCVHRFLPPQGSGAMGFLRVEPAVEPGLVLISAATRDGPGGFSRDGGETWTWLPWPGGTTVQELVALAPLGQGRLVLSITERNPEITRLFVHDGTGWSGLGPVQDNWTTIPLVAGGFIVDPGTKLQAVRFWTAARGWSEAAWNAEEVAWPAARPSRSRSQPALLSDRCGLIGGNGIVWVGADGALVEDVDNPHLAKRAIDGACLVADPSNHKRMWALFHGHGLWHSSDGGSTWRCGHEPLTSLTGRHLRLRQSGSGTVLISDTWSIDDAADHWSGTTPTASSSTSSTTARSAQVVIAMERARNRTTDARLIVSPAAIITVREAVMEVRGDHDGRRARAIEQRLGEAALNGTTQDRVNWVRFLLACAGDPEKDEMLLKGSGVSGEQPSPDIRLQGRLPISAGDLATGQDAAYTLVLARLRGLHSRVPSGVADITIANVREAERLVGWLAACAPQDPAVIRLQAQLEVARATAMRLASGVTAQVRLQEAFGERHAERAAQLDLVIARCRSHPGDQADLTLLAQLACIDADDRDRRSQVAGRSARLIQVADMLEQHATTPPPPAVAMDVLFLRAAAAWRTVLDDEEKDALTTIGLVRGTFHPNLPIRSLRCKNMIERLGDAINSRADRPATDAASCERRLAWRRAGVRIIELVPYAAGRKLRDHHVVLANALAWDLLTLPVRTVHDPDEALRLITRAVERDGRRSAAYLDTLALALCRTNDRAAALRTQEEALTKLGRNAERDRTAYQRRLGVYRDLTTNPQLALPDELFNDVVEATPEKPAAIAPPDTPKAEANDF